MAFDYKKEYKEFYLPKNKPQFIDIPAMNFIAVRGKGDPNEEGGEYKEAIAVLYALAFTIKMSKMGAHKIKGYFEYVVPPLEGLWTQAESEEIDYSRKSDFEWISMIRLPEFATKEVFDWAVSEATAKKGRDFSGAEFFTYGEGTCVQCMHMGTYDSEPKTLANMRAFAEENGWKTDLTEERRHHEIYLSDPRKCAPERLKTVIRIPVKKK